MPPLATWVLGRNLTLQQPDIFLLRMIETRYEFQNSTKLNTISRKISTEHGIVSRHVLQKWFKANMTLVMRDNCSRQAR